MLVDRIGAGLVLGGHPILFGIKFGSLHPSSKTLCAHTLSLNTSDTVVYSDPANI